ncbi:MAG: Fe-S cluster biogenesis protein NfuA [Candidatus Omnitrophota bacterium]|jgi:Fe-S cluster biogenesis protein NfuA
MISLSWFKKRRIEAEEPEVLDAGPKPITFEETPNPQAYKFNVHRQLMERGSMDFRTKFGHLVQGSPLAKAMFEEDSVDGIYVAKDFVTITKKKSYEWADVARPLADSLARILSDESDLLGDAKNVSQSHSPSDDPIALLIQEILDKEIRPEVAQDGGDILFKSYEKHIVSLHMQGACKSCPSAMTTLKVGVERRLKKMIPEIRKVIQV